MPQGFSRVLHSGWYYAVDKASRLTTWGTDVTIDATLALRREAQRSHRIAVGVDPAGSRRRALARLIWRRKFAVICVVFALVAGELNARFLLAWSGAALVGALIFLALEINSLIRRGA